MFFFNSEREGDESQAESSNNEPNEQLNKAATLIQSVYRGHLVREQIKNAPVTIIDRATSAVDKRYRLY